MFIDPLNLGDIMAGSPQMKIEYHMTEEDDELLEDIISSSSSINLHIYPTHWWIAVYIKLPLVNTQACYYPKNCIFNSDRENEVYNMLLETNARISVFPSTDCSPNPNLLMLAHDWEQEEEE